jgi:D-glycero-D-manno-heptose 1,7-bisphosphate phosphatase
MKKALFLDRDGIINTDYGYVYKKEDFKFTEGIFELLRCFTAKGYLLFIVTNQSGIARKYYTLEDFEVLSEWMLKAFEKEDIKIQEIQYCPHLPEDKCICRKPKTAMIDRILEKYSIDLNNSYLIGDKQSDIDLAYHSRITQSIAISPQALAKSRYHFVSIKECKDYFVSNIF